MPCQRGGMCIAWFVIADSSREQDCLLSAKANGDSGCTSQNPQLPSGGSPQPRMPGGTEDCTPPGLFFVSCRLLSPPSLIPRIPGNAEAVRELLLL